MPRDPSLPRVGGLFSLLMIALAAFGMTFGLWSEAFEIHTSVQTGNVNAEFIEAFTDDDNRMDDAGLDSMDSGRCPHPATDDDGDGEVDEDPVDEEDNDGDGMTDEDPAGKLTSCDPAASGADPKPRHSRDVGQCFAATVDLDFEQDGDQNGEVELIDAYPTYSCTAWFRVHNNGTIPVRVLQIDILDEAGENLVEAAEPSTIYPLDLTGAEGLPDGENDLDLHITTIELKQQIDPSQVVTMDLDMQLLDGAPPGATFGFEVLIKLAQWNEVE